MEFVSLVFFGWAASFIAIVWLIPGRYTQYIIAAFGITFIFIIAPIAGIILLAESLICYYAVQQHRKPQWIYTLLSISIVFTAFLVCKYLTLKNSILFPLGIAYFTFRLIHYVQEKYKNRLREHSFAEFMAYITFFPTYLIGPINLFPEFLQDLRRRRWDDSKFSYGIERMIYGYVQLVIGNFLINFLLKNWVSANIISTSDFINQFVYSVQFWLDLYVRFSAYTSIVIGISEMAGFNLPENFNYPFFATNIREFWQRWHMSLTNWCREYIYKPLAAITRNPFLAIGATMITIGIWHELSFRYILWGLYHSLGIIIYEKYSSLKRGKPVKNKILMVISKPVGIFLTIIFVILSIPIAGIINNLIMNLLK
jgi:D-alanyl-lipoteichoic acid acyltransferase DltB (MBOAT superfamily)